MQHKDKFNIRIELFDWASGILYAIVVVILMFAFALSIFTVSGESMVDTLHDGDMVLISNFLYTPQRGDIVMFNKPGVEEVDPDSLFPPSPYVKRVIAVAGDVLSVDYDGNAVYLNGSAIEEPYIRESILTRPNRQEEEIDYPVTVPEGHVFCMGDNRNRSRDSRNTGVGLIDTHYILGRLLFRIFPLKDFGVV